MIERNKLKKILRDHKSLIESFFSLSILNALNIFLPLISLPYILRVIGAANYGIYSFIYILIQYLLLITSYGFNYSATKQISQNRECLKRINIIFNSVIACRLLLLIISFIIFLLLSHFLLQTKIEKLMFMVGVGVVVGDIMNPVWLFQGMEKMRYMTIINFITKSVFTILIFIFIHHPNDFILLILFNTCGYLSSGLASLIIAKKQFGIEILLPTKNEMKYQLKEGLALFGSTIGINAYTNANIFILKFFADDTALGIYAAAEKIIKGLKTLGSPISQALFPHLGYSFNQNTIKDSLRQLKIVSKFFGLILLALTILTFICANVLIHLFGGPEYKDGASLIRIMSMTILLGGMNSLLGFSGLINLNYQKDFLKAVLTSGFFSISFLLLFVSIIGIEAAAWASVLSEAILLSAIFVSFTKIKKKIE